MNKFLDLHGKSIDEATAKVLNTFFEFDQNSYETELHIMVGKGSGALKECVVKVCLEKKNPTMNIHMMICIQLLLFEK